MNIKEQGFTLVELMVTLLIFIVLLVGYRMGFRDTFNDNTLRGTADELQAALQQAKAYAITRSSSIVFNGNARSWTIQQNGTTLFSRTAKSIESNIVTSPNTVNITFNSLGQASQAATIAITNPTRGTCVNTGGQVRCLNVTVTMGGQIKTCDPALATGADPRAC